MGGCRCSYKNCRNTTKTTDNVHFFHYPVKQKDRCKIWIQRAEKLQFFDLDEYQLRNKVICEAHFEDKCFLNSQKKRLLPNAVPSIDGETCLEYEPQNTSQIIPTINKREKTYSKFEDVQILPASDDGTLFVLDTFPSYKISKDVKSYVLNNDSLMPLNDPEPRIKSEQLDDDVEPSDYILGDESNPFQKKLTQQLQQPQKIVNYGYEHSPRKTGVDSDCSPSSSQRISDETLENMICKTVESKYLHKLEQHTKDLNQIKRALKLSRNASKLNKTSVLRFLKLRLPPSLYTLVNLSLDDDYNLTEDDETFFKNLHDSSSKTYQFLMDDCNWRMPIIEIHEEDVSSMEDV